MQWGILRSLALLLAGAIASLTVSIPVQKEEFSWWLIAGLCIIFLILGLVGMGTDRLIIQRYHLWARKRAPKIGILNDMGWSPEDEQIKAWTDISPQVWLQEIEKRAREKKIKVQVKLIKKTNNFAPYSAVINPYGGVYPEDNLASFATLEKTFDYVKEGGLFVNTADLPGYWAYNPLLKKRTETAPPVWDVVPTLGGRIGLRELRPFTIVPWMQRLGLKVLNVENVFKEELNLKFNVKYEQITGYEMPGVRLHRVALLEENVEAVHEMSVSDEFGQIKNVTSMFLATYGGGAFLISLVFITAQLEAIKEKLKGILIDLTLHEITRKVV